MEECIINTPLGFTKITGDLDGINSVTVLNTEEKTTDIIPEILEDCVMQLNEYFEGSRKQFSLKLNPQGTDFQKKVWKQLEKIPYGKTLSYLEISKLLGDSKAIRAVANANGKNPLWIIIPCHRVIGSDGRLTGYAGGLHRKQWLLNHESPFKQLSFFLRSLIVQNFIIFSFNIKLM
ncbi:methylated-DNA--[protein]-cysteine S-methyltransferase [Seonamhaeicola aphaedonensis]|uniref:Methylated-DNA--protein-cysteine methyltransferase n=1 Tax=Seonamhaeicola aphaedonensis TaxID=1461338 RepID=A0A3D9HHA2_9FLAO|nr:methylated-DNA--[protein]-cysteine S-methyltransferase [Seonamhaeicola aphaedonensis]RED48877.1 methylated-DNA-[protein]-cysteine S-methyltransferase [Seonamhaeicola aphaedonensis]